MFSVHPFLLPVYYTYSWNDEFLAQGQFCDVILASAGAAASVMDTRAKGSPVLVYNPAAYSRRSLVEATVDLPAEAEGVNEAIGLKL